MPEGPEVAIMRNRLRRAMGGGPNKLFGTVARLKVINTSNGAKKSADKLRKIVSAHPTFIINKVQSKGKFLYFEGEDPKTGEFLALGNALGMTGYWSTERPEYAVLAIELCARAPRATLFFGDQRHFATFKWYDNKALAKKLGSIGPDVLQTGTAPSDVGQFIERIGRKDRKLCDAVMDQRVLSGVGNYIKSEALFRARLDPFKKVPQCTRAELGKLFRALVGVAKDSYQAGGTDYIKEFRGGRRPQFRFQVYRQKSVVVRGREYPVAMKKCNGRGTYYVRELAK